MYTHYGARSCRSPPCAAQARVRPRLGRRQRGRTAFSPCFAGSARRVIDGSACECDKKGPRQRGATPPTKGLSPVWRCPRSRNNSHCRPLALGTRRRDLEFLACRARRARGGNTYWAHTGCRLTLSRVYAVHEMTTLLYQKSGEQTFVSASVSR